MLPAPVNPCDKEAAESSYTHTQTQIQLVSTLAFRLKRKIKNKHYNLMSCICFALYAESGFSKNHIEKLNSKALKYLDVS